MQWLPLVASSVRNIPPLSVLAAEVTPASSISDSITTILIGYGPLGVIALALAFVLYKGTFTRTSAAEASFAQARTAWDAECKRMTDAHAAEIARLSAALDKAEKQRDDAMTLVTNQLFPLVSAFTSSTNSLLPVLQQLLARGGIPSGRTDTQV